MASHAPCPLCNHNETRTPDLRPYKPLANYLGYTTRTFLCLVAYRFVYFWSNLTCARLKDLLVSL